MKLNNKGITKMQTLGFTAASVAAAASAQGQVVQITMSGNQLSLNGVNNVNLDLTGDGTDELTYTTGGASSHSVKANFFSIIGGNNAYGFVNRTSSSKMQIKLTPGILGSTAGVSNSRTYNPIDESIFVPVKFQDQRINNGQTTTGFMQLRGESNSSARTLTLTRLVFDESDTAAPTNPDLNNTYTEWTPVPEPSSLALLALGAGGIIMRRKRQDA